MRISKAALLVVIAFTVPILVELRTVLAWVNVELTVLESVTLGVAMILAILVWALWPENGESGHSSTR
ncbi:MULTISPECIES: CbaC protein [Natrialba]|uniref:CbaC protein n=1 Tax=Natrialba swarupiae TaxID=2448032 RepID=A0A5D5ASU1_9EURY|nr:MULTISPECIES: CbaC protein [Natrialba]MWV41577.1 CbaC protein [Natrialba sp. INN-245]TYT63945.1 CbaC protein [Natrialba swarupiae]